MENRDAIIEEVVRMAWTDPDSVDAAVKTFVKGYNTGRTLKMASGCTEPEVWESFTKHVLDPMIKSVE